MLFTFYFRTLRLTAQSASRAAEMRQCPEAIKVEPSGLSSEATELSRRASPGWDVAVVCDLEPHFFEGSLGLQSTDTGT